MEPNPAVKKMFPFQRTSLVAQTVKEKKKVLVAQSCPTLCNPMGCSPPGSSIHGDCLGQNTGVGSLSLLQGIFPTQGSNPGRSPSLHVDSFFFFFFARGFFTS